MKFLQKDTWAIIIALVVLFAVLITTNFVIASGAPKASVNTGDSISTSDAVSSGSGDIDMSSYVTYFDLAYAAYTNPDKFLGKEITLVGYYSNSVPLDDTTSSESKTSDTSSESDTSSSTESKSDTTYHFITTYGQVDECHITSEFTTADGKYPDKIGTVIKITGKFSSYEEDGNTYYTIAADTFTTVEA